MLERRRPETSGSGARVKRIAPFLVTRVDNGVKSSDCTDGATWTKGGPVMIRRQRWPRLLKRAALVVPVVAVLAGCNVWTMYGGGPTHSSNDPSNVITTSDASTLAEAGTTRLATGSSSWITSSPTVGSNDMLYATANYAASGSCLGIAYPNDFRKPTDPNDPEITARPTSARARSASCTPTANGGTTNCPTPTPGNPTLNCQPVWTAFPTRTNGLTTAPAIDTSLSTPVVYVGSHDGEVYAYNASTGTLLWHSQTLGGSIDGSLTIANGNVYVPEDYGWVYVFPSTTGTNGNDKNCWTASKARECDPDWGYSTGGNNFATPAVANGMMYQAAGDHVGTTKNDPNQYAVYGFNASYVASECPGTYAPHEYREAALCHRHVRAGLVCSLAVRRPMERRRLVTGSRERRCLHRIRHHRVAGLLGQRLPHCTGTKYVGQWGEICTPLWKASTGKDYQSGAEAGPTPAVANGIVYIGNKAGVVYAFNGTTGALDWSFATGGAIDSSVALAGDTASDTVAFVGCSDAVTGQTCTHSLFALNAASGGTPLWTADTGASVDEPSIIADAGAGSGTGVAYVPTGNQVFVYALPTS